MDVGVGRTEHSPPSVGLSNWISQCVKRASMGVNSRTSIRGRSGSPRYMGVSEYVGRTNSINSCVVRWDLRLIYLEASRCGVCPVARK